MHRCNKRMQKLSIPVRISPSHFSLHDVNKNDAVCPRVLTWERLDGVLWNSVCTMWNLRPFQLFHIPITGNNRADTQTYEVRQKQATVATISYNTESCMVKEIR